MSAPNMIVVNGVRYREEDARRLGFAGPGAVAPAPNEEAPNEEAPEGEDKAPAKSATKGDWTTYALANGKTEADLDGLTRDQIAALFASD